MFTYSHSSCEDETFPCLKYENDALTFVAHCELIQSSRQMNASNIQYVLWLTSTKNFNCRSSNLRSDEFFRASSIRSLIFEYISGDLSLHNHIMSRNRLEL